MTCFPNESGYGTTWITIHNAHLDEIATTHKWPVALASIALGIVLCMFIFCRSEMREYRRLCRLIIASRTDRRYIVVVLSKGWLKRSWAF